MGKDGLRFYEEDIKRALKDKKHMFGDIGPSVLVYEKALSFKKDQSVKKVIADCLIFSENAGIIGIEIKTERDSTRRLLRQLRSYALTCDYVYIMCHDKHVEKVEGILKRNGLPFVGIIAYTAFKGKPTMGIYKYADKSIHKNVFYALNMLWKVELLKLLSMWGNPSRAIAEARGELFGQRSSRVGSSSARGYTTKMPKPQLIKELINRLGSEEANRVLCRVFINNRVDIKRSLDIQTFIMPKSRDIDG